MNALYAAYRKLNLDGSWIGLAQEEARAYFCTPTGAEIIGWDNGIHYCFIEGFGGMVFCVNPESCCERYVYPVARDFRAFLGLILATGNTNVIQQVSGWSREDFDRFQNDPAQREYAARPEVTAALHALQAELGVAPVENPFEVIQALQKDFPYERISFSAAYYDTLGLERPEAAPVTTQEKLHSGGLYLPTDPEVQKEQLGYLDRLYEFNHTRPLELEKRETLLRELFADLGENCYIEPPLHTNWGGHHVHFGSNIYANFNLTLVDDTHIYVGDYTLFGPNVVVATAGHPLWPQLREQGYQYNAPVRIGKNCWIGAGAILVPGVTVGDNAVIGAGSVVTRDIPPNVLAVGNPCRVLREINEHDREYYFKNRKIVENFWP